MTTCLKRITTAAMPAKFSMDYITVKEAASQKGVTARYIQILAKKDRIPGAVWFNRVWLIPKGFTITKPPKK